MKRYILFSTPTENNIDRVLTALLPAELDPKVLGYIPSAGSVSPVQYEELWRQWAAERGYQLVPIYNDKTGAEAKAERAKLDRSSSILITGGNTFTLLHNLRQSGLDQAIIIFSQKPDFVIGGFSAGAIVLTPTIKLAGAIGDYDENNVGITNLTGLKLIDFEVCPHHEPRYAAELDRYRATTPNRVQTITDEEVEIINQDAS